MTLSIAANTAVYGKPLGSGVAGLTAVAEAGQRSGAAASWSYVPPSDGRRGTRLPGLMEVLSRLSTAPDAAAGDRSSRLGGNASGSTPGNGPARSDAADLLQALNDAGEAPATTAVPAPKQSAPEQDPQPVLAQRPATDVVSTLQLGLPPQDVTADPSFSAADAQLQALFKTLQAYGL